MRAKSDLRRLLETANLTSVEAAALAHILVDPMDRPRSELVEYLRRFPDVAGSDSGARQDVVAALLDKHLLTVDLKPSGAEYLRPATCDFIAGNLALPAAELESHIQAARRAQGWSVQIMDHRGSSVGYTSWLELLKSARYAIDLCIFASAYEAVVPIIKSAGESGIRVRVLVGDPELVATVRGGRERAGAEQALATWRNAARSPGQRSLVKVRTIRHPEDLTITGSSLVDEQYLRFTIFDPPNQRGSEGKLLEVADQSPRSSVNLIDVYQRRYEDAWKRAHRLGLDSIVRWLQILLASLLIVLLVMANRPSSWDLFPKPVESFALSNMATINSLISVAMLPPLLFIGRQLWRSVRDATVGRTVKWDDD